MFIESWTNKEFSRAIANARGIITADAEKFIEFSKKDEDGFLSDIFSAICEDDYRFRYYHDKTYWQRPGNKEKEIFANFFSFEIFSSKSQWEIFVEIFSEIFNAYSNLWR